MSGTKKFSLKDHLFNSTTVIYLASLIKGAYSKFDDKLFIKNILDALPELELKQRITHISNQLKNLLPSDYKEAVEILVLSLPPELNPAKTDDDFGDFILAPLSEFVAKNGCHKKHYDISMHALKEMTKRFSAEDAIRYFINQFPDKTHKAMMELTQSGNYHQRRLASEGSRLSLPWAQKIVWTPKDILPILDQLYFDSTRYVTRSVANSLNDVSKIDPSLVLETLKRWQKSEKQNKKEMTFITKHSLRTLLKKGNPKALQMLGYAPASHVEVSQFNVGEEVKLGQSLPFSFTLTSTDQHLGKLRIEYAIYFKKANGKQNAKVFKVGEAEFSENKKTFSKKHSFKEMTTRKHHVGEHGISIIVNGKGLERRDFMLTD